MIFRRLILHPRQHRCVHLERLRNHDLHLELEGPDQPPLDPRGQKVAAVFISLDEGSRRAAEDELVRQLNEHGASGIASYRSFLRKTWAT